MDEYLPTSTADLSARSNPANHSAKEHTMPKMRAKFQVSSVTKFQGGYEKVDFVAVSKSSPYPEDGSDEDNTYAKFSPQASCSITIANPALHGKYEPGQKFYVDFTPAP